ncbi:MAG: ATPase, partial [Acidobacteriota bacterium]|nr:ATPase [Acidobacteriota bacterium]
MYEQFYGFRQSPFNITPDPHFLFLSERHREAFNHLLYGIEARKGFIQITGEVGAGKTTLSSALLE